MNRNLWISSGIFLCAFLYSLIGLNPTFYLDDSPEIISSSTTLGIAHPPGYPLFILIAHLFSLLPLSQVCFRINLLSAFLTACVCALLFLFLKNRLNLSTTCGLTFSLLWMTGIDSYTASLSAKTGIYVLTVLFLILIFYFLSQGKFLLFCFIWGLSLTNHWMSILGYSIGITWSIVSIYKKRTLDFKKIIVGLSFILIALSTYLYLPLRAIQNPLINWGDPSNYKKFLFHVFRMEYQNSREIFGSPLKWIQQLEFYFKLCIQEFYGIGVFSLLGLYWIWKKKNTFITGLAISWIAFVVVLITYVNLPKSKFYLLRNFSISSLFFLVVFSALGFDFFIDSFNYLKRKKRLISLISLFCVFLLINIRTIKNQQTFYTYTYNYILNAWRSLPRHAFFFCKGDAVEFPCWYLQLIRGQRKDLVVLGSGSLPMAWYRLDQLHLHPHLKIFYPTNHHGKEYIHGHLFHWMVAHNPNHRYFFNFYISPHTYFQNSKTYPYGITERMFLNTDDKNFNPQIDLSIWKTMQLPNFRSPDNSLDNRTRITILNDYSIARTWLGSYYIQRAMKLKKALASFPKNALKIQSLIKKGMHQFLWAHHWNPQNPQYSFQIAIAYYFLGKFQKSKFWLHQTIQINSKFENAYYYLGVINYQLNNLLQSVHWFHKTLQINPNNIQAQQAINYIRQKLAY